MRRLFSPTANRQALVNLVGVLWRYRELTWEMTRRDLFDRHTGSVLGPLWVIVQPTLVILIQTFVFSVIFNVRLGTGEAGASYVTYLLAGLVPWMAFQEAIGRAPTAITENRSLVRQIVFPISILPVKTVLATLVMLLIGLAVIAILILFHSAARPEWWLLAPLPILCQLLITVGISYFLAAIAVFVRDTKTIVQFVLMIGLFLHPIVYVPSMLPGWLTFVFIFQAVMHPLSWALCPILGVILMVMGYRVFRMLSHNFGEML
jgi:lipopolysaccharide transport system permease protein